jgi:fatty-acid desaturase
VPFADGDRPPGTLQDRVQAVTTAFVVVPFAGLGVTVGFHRLLTHHSFTAAPALRVAVAGSLSFGRLA